MPEGVLPNKADRRFIEERAVLAILEGDELGSPLTLGLIRRALESYQNQRATMNASAWYWGLKDQPWRNILPPREHGFGVELVGPWSAMSVVAVKSEPGEPTELLNVARATVAMHGLATTRKISHAEVIRRIEAATHAIVRTACRQCSCEHRGLWSDFVWVGVQPAAVPSDRALELRNCPRCETTLAREIL